MSILILRNLFCKYPNSLQSYTYLLSIIVFLSTLKFLKLLRFNKRIGMLSSTLAVAAKPVAQFMLMFLCIFTGYTMMAYVLFNTHSLHFSSFVTTMETLFSAMLSKFFIWFLLCFYSLRLYKELLKLKSLAFNQLTGI